MSLYRFTDVRKWVAETAREFDVKLSNRKCKEVASAWIIEREMEWDGVGGDLQLHSDPTGDLAVKRLLVLMGAA